MKNTKMKKRCEICNIELDEHDFVNHVQGKRHLKNVEAANYKKGFLEKSIYVSRMPPGLTMDNVVNFFTQFGVIERCKLEPHFAIIEFRKKETVNFLLSRPIWMGRHRLDIKRRKWNNSGPTSTKNDSDKIHGEINFAELKTKLQAQTSLETEIATFLETVQLKEDEVENNWLAIHASLLEALKPIFPNCEIIRFGSSITGLCFAGSDIDIYVNIGEQIYEDDEKKHGWTPRTIFKEAKSYMYKRKNIFESIVPIPKAKTPIIKFCHSPTAKNCDISFKNGLGVINSQLIKHLIGLDVRIKPLMMIVKFWAKTFELSGCGKFTNYAIVMMIIFYLQQPEIKLLPAIVELQSNCEPIYSWNWQVNFDRSAKFSLSTNESNITELIAGFFKFYANFPFAEKLISPSDGIAHTRKDFAKSCIVKGIDADNLALDRPLCLQDPIELDNNITCGVTGKLLEIFHSFCMTGIEVFDVALQKPNEPFLLDLFTKLPAPLENQASLEITISAFKTLRAGLPKDFETRNDIEDKEKFAEDNWHELSGKLVEDALRRVFKLDIQGLKNDREAKQQKVAETSDVHSKDNEKIVLECIGNYCVIGGRKAKSFCIDPSLSRIDKEALISEELVKKQMDDGVRPSRIDFTCTILRERNPLRLILRLNDRNSAKKRFRPLASFIRTKLPSIIDKELMHIIQYDKVANL